MSVININVGVLGHVDSGKTSLCKVLSTIASTACFDKNPQSKERGITLDLGFSSFQINQNEIPNDIKENLALNEQSILQYTLVDCPGHASLIRTIICGAQIIDLMILVIDVIKGIQTQTAECLVIGEILCNKMLIVLNKIDLIPEKDRESTISKMKKRLNLTLAKTKFGSCSIIEISASPGGGSVENDSTKVAPIGIDNLITALVRNTENPSAKRLQGSKDPLILSIDHCFSIRGQGTILTGTVLAGSLEVGESLHIPSLELDRKVKSIQMFRKPVSKAMQGDRIGVCVTQMDAGLLERGLACHTSSPSPANGRPLALIESCIMPVSTIAHFKVPVSSKSKYHFIVGQDTVMGTVTLFTRPATQTSHSPPISDGRNRFDWSVEYQYLDGYSAAEPVVKDCDLFALVQFERPVVCATNSLIISSKLDIDIHSNVCRLAFYGRPLWMSGNSKYAESDLPNLKVYKWKRRYGQLERLNDSRTAIVKSLFKKETNIDAFQRMRVRLEQLDELGDSTIGAWLPSPGVTGHIEGGFGQSGKCKVILDDEVPAELAAIFGAGKRKKGAARVTGVDGDESGRPLVRAVLEFKRFVFDPSKKMVQ